MDVLMSYTWFYVTIIINALNLMIIIKNEYIFALSSFPPFFYFSGVPMAYGSSQARGQIGATAGSLHHSHMGSEPRVQPTP